MPIPFQRSYKKRKERNLLVLSAGGEASGIQGLYFVSHDDTWEIYSHTFIPYPQKLAEIIESCKRQKVSIADIGLLECKITQLFIECARTVLQLAPRGGRKPDLCVLNQPVLFNGPTGENDPFRMWDIAVGDPQFLARSLSVPVLSDFTRYAILTRGESKLPLLSGQSMVARRYSGTVVFLNIGLMAHMTIIDKTINSSVIDADTGPGMCLINRCAQECGSLDGFDRDGALSAGGTVNSDCLKELSSNPWFMKETPQEASIELFEPLLRKPCVMSLSQSDRMATITALTARTIHDFFSVNYKGQFPPETIILSGGGVNNISLMGYLAAYFNHTPMASCDTIGIPLDMMVPLALGLSVDCFLRGKDVEEGNEKRPANYQIGRVSIP